MSQKHENGKTEVNSLDETASAMMTPDQAWRAAGGQDVISRASFYAGLNRKEIPAVRVGRRFLIPRHAFLRWLEGSAAEVR
jgi:excisionase family DNA binding protein